MKGWPSLRLGEGGVAMATVAVACLAVFPAITASQLGQSASAVFSGCVLVGALVVMLTARRGVGPRGPLLVAVSTLGVAPCVLVAVISSYDAPIVRSLNRFHVWPWAILLFLFVAGQAASHLLGRVVALRPRVAWDRALRVGAIVLLVPSIALTVASAVHARGRFERDDYVASLPAEAHLDNAGSAMRPAITDVLGLKVTRTTDEGRRETCRVYVEEQECPGTCDAIDIRPDGRAHLLIFTTQRPDGEPQPLFAVRSDTKKLVDVFVRDVKSELCAPRRWTQQGAVACFIALLFVVSSLWPRRTLPTRDASTPYREPGRTEAGAAEEAELREGTPATAHAAWAILALALGMMPLVAATILGIAF